MTNLWRPLLTRHTYEAHMTHTTYRYVACVMLLTTHMWRLYRNSLHVCVTLCGHIPHNVGYMCYCSWHTCGGYIWREHCHIYKVASMSRLYKIIGLFCRMSSLLQGSFTKETYNFKEPTDRSHPIASAPRLQKCGMTYSFTRVVCASRFQVRHDSFIHICNMIHFQTCDMTHMSIATYSLRNLLSCATWLILAHV